MPTPHQVHLLQHALGTDRGGMAYRNAFVAAVGSPDDLCWRDLVRAGWAEVSADWHHAEATVCYRVTAHGRTGLMILDP